MRLLVLGGTVFLSRATAAEAVARGHEVTCAARGVGGDQPPGAELVRLDRDHADWARLAGRSWDAVVDVARYPSWVAAALAALGDRAGHWVFVSTCSVYSDHATPAQRADTAPLLAAPGPGADERDPSLYGELKVACEQVVREHRGDRALVARAGLIVGPGDPSGRFTYWPHRMAESATVVAPGEPDEPVQLVDVRDLARWLVVAAEQGLSGTFDTVGPPMARGAMLSAVAAGVGVQPELVWVPQEFLLAQDVRPWSGERSLPLWLPLPEYAGFMSRDVSPALAAGLGVRPLEQTAQDTLDWLQQHPGAPVTGLTAAEQRRLLHEWRKVDLELS